MQINDVYIRRSDGRRTKIVAAQQTQGMSEIETRYRLSGDDRFLTAQQVRREYAAVLEPELAHGRGR